MRRFVNGVLGYLYKTLRPTSYRIKREVSELRREIFEVRTALRRRENIGHDIDELTLDL